MYDAEEVGGLYRIVSLLGVAIATGGVIGEVRLSGEVRRGLWAVDEVFFGLQQLEPSAFTTLGIWVLICGPILALISMFISGARKGSKAAMLLSAAVLLMIVLSVPIKVWLSTPSGL